MALRLLDANLQDVRELLEIPKLIPGRRHKILQINKTAIVLITASFETFIESLAMQAFDFLIVNSHNPNDVPTKVKNMVASHYINSADRAIPWSFAGDGWRTVLLDYKQEVIQKYIGPFHNPTPDNIDNLFSELIGLKHVTRVWLFHPSRYNAKEIYKRFLNDRHAIVHKNEEPSAPSVFYARRYLDLVEAIAQQTSVEVDAHLKMLTNASVNAEKFPQVA